MKSIKIAALLAVAGLTSSVGAAPATKPVAADWTRTVVTTPEGGFAMGNPKAKVTLVEYASLTCSHCRDFAAQAYTPLKAGYIRRGLVRFEYRSFILNGADLSATLMARCGGARTFFPIAERMFASQTQWIGRIQAARAAADEDMENMSPAEQSLEIARRAGFHSVASANGIAPARVDKCLADVKAAQRLIDGTNAARARGVRGTPTFFLNGSQVAGNDWASVEAAIKAAL